MSMAAPRRRQGWTARVAARLGILLILAGIPYALVVLAGNPLPDQVPSWQHIGELLTSRDDGRLFLGAIAWAGWIGWASFALPLLVEIACRAFRWRTPPILGLAWQQRRAAALVTAALSIAAAPAMASTSAVTIATTAAPAAAAPASAFGIPAAFTSPPSSQPALAGVMDMAPQGEPIYEVARGDWLYHVAKRFLGDGDRYTDIAKLNPELKRVDHRFPDHIEAHQRIRLPADEQDRGARPHATGKLRAPAEPPPAVRVPEPAPTQPPGPSAPQETPTYPVVPSLPAPDSFVGASASPASSPAASAQPSQREEPGAPGGGEQDPSGHASDGGELDLVLPVTATLATAGLLAALLLIRLEWRRRRQRQHRRPGRRIPQTADPVIEQRARAAAQPTDVDRLDHALRALAASLGDRDAGDLPDLAGAWLSGGEVHLVLAQANSACPPPFQADDTAMTWALPADAALPDVEDVLAPLPALVTVASRPAGDHLLIDLERCGVLGLGGDPEGAAELMRYLAAELATNQWSDDAEIVLAGFDPSDAASLIAIGGERITVATSTAAALERASRRVAANTAAMASAGITSTLAGRVGDIVADAWMPHVLLIADSSGVGEQLAALEAELRRAGRCGVAVAAVTDTPKAWHVEISSDGGLAIDWLSITNANAARLPREQLTRLAAVMRAARATTGAGGQPADEPVPAAAETEPWAEGTDAHGHLITAADPEPGTPGGEPMLGPDLAGTGSEPAEASPAAPLIGAIERERRPAVSEPDHHAPSPAGDATSPDPADATTLASITTAEIRSPRQAPTAPPPVRRRPDDADLDADLDAWSRPDPYRPRVAVLGPVVVEAPGEPPDERLRFYSELVVYLTQRGRAGATGEQIDDALWGERGVNARSRRVAISKVRRWLGEDRNGTLWLPPNIGTDRRYRLIPGVLLDWQLFRRLRARGEANGPDGADDLRRALELVRGEPLAGAELPYSSGYRNPYTWLPGSDVQPHNLASAIVDTAHQLVGFCLSTDDVAGARWAVERAWLAESPVRHERVARHPRPGSDRRLRETGRQAPAHRRG